METREWTTVDKSTWGPGEWQTEPDKKQWADPATGLPCLAVRNGHWCGYVGVPKGHPWHGVDYSSCALPTATRRGEKPEDAERPEFMRKHLAEKTVCGEETWCDHRPEGLVEVHGGLTFSDRCVDMGPEQWERGRARRAACEQEARTHPFGDAARWLAEWGPALDDLAAWQERMRATTICHIPEPGESDDVWWFGFDCAHSFDLSPRYGGFDRRYLDERATYRSLGYVERQCAKLAEQLKAVTPA